MKLTLLALFCASLTASLAQAAVDNKTDCGSNNGPQANNLALSVDSGDHILTVGYETMGVFFPLRLVGCDKIDMAKGALLCSGAKIGSIGKFESTDDDDGTPRGDLKIDAGRDAVLSGSCDPKKTQPLTLTLSK
ncbi:MAG: hypothetical protein ACXWR1_16025 [Bdellovibrionota bacterium]